MRCSSDCYYKCSWNNKWKNNNNYTTVALNSLFYSKKSTGGHAHGNYALSIKPTDKLLIYMY